MHIKLIDPDRMIVSDANVDLNDFRAIQQAIGNRSYEVIRATAGTRLYVDANARVRPDRPTRFLLPSVKDRRGEPMSIYGKALLVLDGNRSCPEIVFPQEQRVTSLDRNFQNLGCFVSTIVGCDPSNLNFHAILSDERFVAATRVVLATFEPHILNAVPSHGLCPMLELEIDEAHLETALDLYDDVLTVLGYCHEQDDEDGDADGHQIGILRLPTGGGKSGLDGQHRTASIQGVRAWR